MNVPPETGLLDDATIRPDGKKGYTPHEPPQLAEKGVPFSLQPQPSWSRAHEPPPAHVYTTGRPQVVDVRRHPASIK